MLITVQRWNGWGVAGGIWPRMDASLFQGNLLAPDRTFCIQVPVPDSTFRPMEALGAMLRGLGRANRAVDAIYRRYESAGSKIIGERCSK